MKFPVDVLGGVSPAELEQRAQKCMSELLYDNPESPEQLTLPNATQLDISISTVGLVPLYGCCDSLKVLALFAPADPFTPAALYLLGQWWSVGDILRTADSTRDGLLQVEMLGDRVVLYVLNRVVYRVQEMNSDELPFLCHGAKDFAKILWQNGEAVGFYSVKPTGSSCSSFSSRSYPLPVLDSMFVRKGHRGKGLGLHMLEDYVDSFKDDHLGLKYPLTTAMYKVCQSYLRAYPGDAELLWEVDSCRLNQRTSIANRLHSMSLTGVSRTLTYTEQSAESGAVHHTQETVEEVTVVKSTKGAGSRHRSAGHRTTEEQPASDIRITEEVTLLRSVQNSEVVQTEELLKMTTENGSEIVVTELEEDAVFDNVTSLQTPEEETVTLGSEEVPQNLNTLCSTVITVENVASEVEECSHIEEHHTGEDSRHQTAPPQAAVTVERVLRTRTVVNIPQLSNVGDAEGESEMTQETKDEELAEEELLLHRKALRATTPKSTRKSTRLKKGQEYAANEEDTAEQEPNERLMTEEQDQSDAKDSVEGTGMKECMTADDAVPEEDIKDQEPEKAEEDILAKEDEAVQGERDTIETTTIVESVSPDAKEEAASTEAEDTEQPEIPVEMDKQSQPEPVREQFVAEAESNKGPEPESPPEDAEEAAAPIVETRSLRSGTKIVAVTPKRTLSNVCVDAEVISEPIDNEDVQSEAPTPENVPELTPSQTKDPEDVPEAAVVTEEASTVVETNQEETLSSTQEEVVETRVLRSAAKTTSVVSTPRTTRSSKHLVEEEDVEKATIKRDRKSTGRKQVRKSKGQTQEQRTSSAEEDTAEEIQQQTSDLTTIENNETSLPIEADQEMVNKDEPAEDSILTETKEAVAAEDLKDQESTLAEDTLDQEEEKVQSEIDITMEETAVAESASADATEEKREEAPSTEAVVTEQTEISGEMDKESQPELSEAEPNKEPEPESPPEEEEEAAAAPTVETRSLRSGTKTVTATPKSILSKMCAEAEIISESIDNEDVQSETQIPESVPELTPFQTKDPEETSEDVPEEVPEAAVVTEEASSAAETKQEETLSSTQDEVIETRVLRSATKRANVVSTPRTTRRSRRLVEEEVVEKATIKQGRKSTGRKRVSKSLGKTQEQRPSSAEEDTTEEVQQQTSDLPTIENNETSLPVEADQEMVNNNDAKDSVLTETKEAVAAEDIKDQESTLEEDNLDQEDEKVQSERDITMEEAVVAESASADATEEKTEEAASTEAEDTEQIEIPVEMDKESQPEPAEAEPVKEPEPESLPEEVEETQSQTKDAEEVIKEAPKEVPEEVNGEAPDEVSEAAVVTEEATSVAVTDQEETLSPTQDEVIETRVLRSAGKTASVVLTPRTTRRSRRLVAEEVVEAATIKRGRKSTGTKQVSKSKGQTQEQRPSSAEEGTTEEDEKVQSERDITMEEAAVAESASADAPDEKKEEAPSTADEESVPLSTTEAEDTEQTEIPVEMDKESQPEPTEAEPIKEPEPESPPEQAEDIQPQTKDAEGVIEEASKEVPEEAPETALVTEETSSVVTANQEETLSSTQDEVIETRVLRSGAKTTSVVSTPRTTRRSKRLVEEEVVEVPTIKRGRKSTGRKRVSKSKGQTQEQRPSSEEEDMTEDVQQQTSDLTTIENKETSLPIEADQEINNDELAEDSVLTETKDVVAAEDLKDQESTLAEDTLDQEDEKVQSERDITMEETAVAESASADATEEKTEEAASTEAEDTEQTEIPVEMDKESQPEPAEAEPVKEPEPESLPEETEEIQPQTKDAEEVIEEAPKEVPEEVNGEAPDEVSEAAVVTEEASSVAVTDQEETTQDEVTETRVLRRGAKTTSVVSTPRTTRSSRRLIEEEVVEATTIKRGRKSTGKKRVSKSQNQTQEQRPSSAEEDTTEEVQAEDTLDKEDEKVPSEREITMEEAAVAESARADTPEEKKEEESSKADESVPLSPTETEDTEQIEIPVEMDKESQPEPAIEQSVAETEPDKEPESIPEEAEEAPIVKTRSLRSGTKTVKATIKHRHTAEKDEQEMVTENNAPVEVDQKAETKTPEEVTSSPQENLTDAQAEMLTNLPPCEETVTNVDPSDNPKQTEIKHQTSVDGTSLPRLSVVLVDVNKVHSLKSDNKAAVSQIQDTMEDMQNQLEDSSKTEDATEQNQAESSVAETNEEESHQDHTDLIEVNTENTPEDATVVTTLCTEDESKVNNDTSAEDTPTEETKDEASPEVTPELPEADHTEIEDETQEPHMSQTRRSSRKRPRVDYRDHDDKLDLSDFPESDDVSKSPRKHSRRTRKSAPKPESEEEEELPDSLVLSLRLDEDEEQSASDEEPLVIPGKNLRNRSVPSIVISPQSTPRHSTVLSPKDSPEQTPRQLKRRSAKESPLRTSKRHRK